MALRQLFGCIDGEHTAKNVMITAVKRGDIHNENHIMNIVEKVVKFGRACQYVQCGETAFGNAYK